MNSSSLKSGPQTIRSPQAAQMRKTDTREAPPVIGPYSQATIINGFIFVSGQLPVDPKTGRMADPEIKTQTAQVIENIGAILRETGSDLASVVRCDVFLTNMNDFEEMNKVYASRFVATPKPARQCVQVVRLPLDAMVEISCIAYTMPKLEA